jgi:hypothetical protein
LSIIISIVHLVIDEFRRRRRVRRRRETGKELGDDASHVFQMKIVVIFVVIYDELLKISTAIPGTMQGQQTLRDGLL